MKLKSVAILALFAVICAADDAMKCLDDNDDYLAECLEVLGLVSIPTDTDPMPVICSLFGLMSHCAVGRAAEKCGEAGGEKVAETLTALLPPELEPCKSQEIDDSVVEFLFGNILDQAEKGQLGLLDRNKRQRGLYNRKKRQSGLYNRKKRQLGLFD